MGRNIAISGIRSCGIRLSCTAAPAIGKLRALNLARFAGGGNCGEGIAGGQAGGCVTAVPRNKWATNTKPFRETKGMPRRTKRGLLNDGSCVNNACMVRLLIRSEQNRTEQKPIGIRRKRRPRPTEARQNDILIKPVRSRRSICWTVGCHRSTVAEQNGFNEFIPAATKGPLPSPNGNGNDDHDNSEELQRRKRNSFSAGNKRRLHFLSAVSASERTKNGERSTVQVGAFLRRRKCRAAKAGKEEKKSAKMP